MNRLFLLLTTLALAIIVTASPAKDDNIKGSNGVQYKSELAIPTSWGTFGPDNSSYPMPFDPIANTRTMPAISTGYYFVDSHEFTKPYSDAPWHPVPAIEDTNDTHGGEWIRIMTGPRQMNFTDAASAAAYWATNVNGHTYFRNPALPAAGSWFEHGTARATDSTDDAIAGPMPLAIKDGFYFNGVRYDSFYVSTNGIIALTNRRYLYADEGNRKIGTSGDCYDRMSMDWFNPVPGRARTGREGNTTSLLDPTPDNFGYQYAVLHNNPYSAQAGIRTRGGHLNTVFNNTYRSAVIAPFFGDLHLSQWWASKKVLNPFGRVYFKKFNDQNKLVIYFINAGLKGSCRIPPADTSITVPADGRPGEKQTIFGSAQVVLNRLDSSITIQYEIFSGFANMGNYGAYAAKSVFLWNTTCGVLGWARHVNNYKAKNAVAYQEYMQYTHYFSRFATTTIYDDYLVSGKAVRFKQWRNTLRVLTLSYRVRSIDNNESLDFTEAVPTSLVDNYELLAGEERIGAVQPVAVIQNLTNDITEVDSRSPGAPNTADYPATGVNAISQDFNYRARFRIFNQALNKIVYNRLMPIDSTGIYLASDYDAQATHFGNPYSKVRLVTVSMDGKNYKTTEVPKSTLITNDNNGIPPYGFAEIYFPPFEPNKSIQDKYNNFTNIGRMKVDVETDPTDPRSNEYFGDEWPADNKLSRYLFVMKRLSSFSEDVSDWNYIKDDREFLSTTAMASVEKWVNIGTQVVVGDNVSHHPLPPRQELQTGLGFRNKNWMYEGIGSARYKSPVIKMDRREIDGSDVQPLEWGGDELRSFPIDLKQRKGAVLALSIQRTNNGPNNNIARGFSDAQIIGCEPRAILNGDPNTPFNHISNAVSEYPDELWVELAKPSPDQVHGITNIGVALPFIDSDKRGTWREHPRRGGLAPITNMAAYLLYGAGGALRGFLETDKDSALTTTSGLRANYLDDGFDETFRKIIIPIPDTFITAPNEGAKNFRFRVKVNAQNSQKKAPVSIQDDADEFYLDNVSILFPSEMTDIEVSSVDITWPYTIVPASQATNIPVRVKISNNTSIAAPSFFVKVKIYANAQGPTGPVVYCKRVEMPFLSPGEEVEVKMPDFDATNAGGVFDTSREFDTKPFHIMAIVRIPGGDLEVKNDTTFYNVALTLGKYYAYDNPAPEGTKNGSNVPAEAIRWSNEFYGIEEGHGRGLTLQGYNFGGIGSAVSISRYDADPNSFGPNGGSASGQLAMKFELFKADTILGYQAYFGWRTSAPDYITFSVYNDMNGKPGQQPIASSLLKDQKGWDKFRKDYFYDEYVTYLLPEPLILSKGKYWVAVAQLGQDGLDLGASGARMGMRTMNVHIQSPIHTSREVGIEGSSLLLHKEFRDAESLLNNNLFAYENTYQSGSWVEFMPTTGNIAYANLHHFGDAPGDRGLTGMPGMGFTWTLTRATWIPFVRPFFGKKYIGKTIIDDCGPPVELTTFNGKSREEGIDLFWETASEINNHGFYVERRDLSDNGWWEEIAFVNGAGSSSNIKRYKYFDKNVVLNSIYEYRLNQVDLDGSKDCGSYSHVIRIKFGQEGILILNQNMPNPFTETTIFSFVLPENARVKLEVLDLFGNVLKTIVDQELNASSYTYYWDRLCDNSKYAPNGTYIYRLTAGEEVRTGKMTIVR